MRRLPTWCLPTILAVALGCASARPEGQLPPGDDRVRALAAAEDDLRRAEADLGSLAAQAQGVDCARAFLLRDNVCTLAARICKLAEGMPGDATAPGRCGDARARCQAARARVAVPCPEPGAPAP